MEVLDWIRVNLVSPHVLKLPICTLQLVTAFSERQLEPIMICTIPANASPISNRLELPNMVAKMVASVFWHMVTSLESPQIEMEAAPHRNESMLILFPCPFIVRLILKKSLGCMVTLFPLYILAINISKTLSRSFLEGMNFSSLLMFFFLIQPSLWGVELFLLILVISIFPTIQLNYQ